MRYLLKMKFCVQIKLREKLLVYNPKLAEYIERNVCSHCCHQSIKFSKFPMMSFGIRWTTCASYELESNVRGKVCSISVLTDMFMHLLKFHLSHFFHLLKIQLTLTFCFSATNAAPHLDRLLSVFCIGICSSYATVKFPVFDRGFRNNIWIISFLDALKVST